MDNTVTPFRRRERRNTRPAETVPPAQARRLRELAAAWAGMYDVSALLAEADAIEHDARTSQIAA
jgi:hypothetical protein